MQKCIWCLQLSEYIMMWSLSLKHSLNGNELTLCLPFHLDTPLAVMSIWQTLILCIKALFLTMGRLPTVSSKSHHEGSMREIQPLLLGSWSPYSCLCSFYPNTGEEKAQRAVAINATLSSMLSDTPSLSQIQYCFDLSHVMSFSFLLHPPRS